MQYRNCKHNNTASWLAIDIVQWTMQRWKSLRYTEAWRIYAIALLNVLLSSSHLVHSCEELDSGECGLMMVPTNKTNIVDLNSSGCNDTHIWISWSASWTTPTGCDVKKVVLTGGYTCFMEDGSQLDQSFSRKHSQAPWGDTEWSHEHSAWNTSEQSVTECTIDGYFEIDRPCLQKLLPVNLTCSNPVQPTSTSYLPMMTSSPSAPISMTMAHTLRPQETPYTSMQYTLTVHSTPTTTPELNASFQTSSEIQTVIIIAVVSIVAMLLVLSSFVAVMLMRWKNKKPIINNYINYDKDLLDFKPGFSPVIPDEMVFKGDAISIQSTITPLEKIESAFILTDISTAPSQTQKLSQPKDYRQLG